MKNRSKHVELMSWNTVPFFESRLHNPLTCNPLFPQPEYDHYGNDSCPILQNLFKVSGKHLKIKVNFLQAL